MATIVNKIRNPDILTIDDMESVYQKIRPADLEVLSIKAHNHTVTFESQMQSRFRDIALNLQPDLDRGYTLAEVTTDFENAFLSIFYSTKGKILLKQIKDEDELVEKLLDLDSGSDSVTYLSAHGTVTKSFSDTTNTSIDYLQNSNLSLNQTVNTDRNSQGLIKLQDNIVVQNPNFASSNTVNTNDYGKHGKSDTGKALADSTGLGAASSQTSSSNLSKDLRELLGIESRDLRTTFLKMFNRLFR